MRVPGIRIFKRVSGVLVLSTTATCISLLPAQMRISERSLINIQIVLCNIIDAGVSVGNNSYIMVYIVTSEYEDLHDSVSTRVF